MMKSQQIQHIWKSETGIQPLPEPWESLHVADFDSVRNEWRELRAQIGEGPQLQEALNQLYREWAIETGAIENLYDIERGTTESLIVKGITTDLMEHGSVNRDPVYIKNLIDDQQAALDGLFDFIKSDRVLSTSYIKEMHVVMTRSQGEVEARTENGETILVPLLRGAWKVHPNYPVRDGVEFHYCPPEHVDAEMDRLVAMYREYDLTEVPKDVLAAWLHHRFTQIHPFQDGNGRIARALATLVLVKAGVEPFVVTRDDRASYISALEFADDGNLRPLCLTIARRVRAQFVKTSGRLREILAATTHVDHPAERVKRILVSKRAPKSPEIANLRSALTFREDFYRELSALLRIHTETFDDQGINVKLTYEEAYRSDFVVFPGVKSEYTGQTMDHGMSHIIRMIVGGQEFRVIIDPISMNLDVERLLVLQFTFYWSNEIRSQWWRPVSDTDHRGEVTSELARETDIWIWEKIADVFGSQAEPTG